MFASMDQPLTNAYANIIPKKEPKLEPADLLSPIPIPIPIPAIPRTLALTPPDSIHSPLQSLSPNIADEHRRLRHFIHSVARKNPNANLNPHRTPNPNTCPNSTAIVPFNDNKRKKTTRRSSDLRRVSFLTSEEAVRIRSIVRRTRILYESIRLRLLQKEDDPLSDRRRLRSDMNAATLMKDADLWLNRENRTVGFIPGVHIGDIFFYRIELCVIGLHGLVQAGIDFVTPGQSLNGEPIATSIIISGGYEDDDDQGDVLVYTGSGGREGKNDTKQSLDQKLKGGNLALERSYNYGIEIRVIRGLSCERSMTNKVYVYDGLYRIEKWWTDVGKSGFTVYKFRLVRLEGQEEMGSVVLKSAEELKKHPNPNRYLCADISKGKEKEPVAVVNSIDGRRDPLQFSYQLRPTFQSFVTEGLGARGCRCVSDCGVGCECVEGNGGELAYDHCGRLLKGRHLLYECGKHCGCPSSCMNRPSHKGLWHRLEIFRSVETGWGVRSLDIIRAGEFVCEFIGIFLTKEETELAAKNDNACLVYPNRFPRRWEEWGDLSAVSSHCEKPEFPPVTDVGYAIDVSRARNVACYLSHSSNPNVFVQFVLRDHYNVKFPRLMIFAMENIPPLRELSLDYGIGNV